MKRTFNLLVLVTLVALIFGALGATSSQAKPLYSLGTYPNTSVVLGGNTTVTPDVVPTGTTSISVYTNTNFKGTFVANPTSGVVRVTNAHPAGTYTVTVRAFGASPATATFTLTVTSGVACVVTPAFTSATNISPVAGLVHITLGDFNNDGNQDFVTANSTANVVSIRLGNGAGGFSGPAVPQISVGTNPRATLVGDFNGDGNQDLAVANFTTQNVSIRLGNGAGGFSNAPNVTVAPGTPQTIVGGDFNNDGNLDFATANSDATPATVSIRLGDGAGGFSGATNITVGTNNAYDLVAGDFNGDGNLDIATANFWDYNVAVLLGNGAGDLGSPTNYSMGTTRPASVTLGDFNNDGKQDIAVAGQFENTVQIMFGTGTGSFTLGSPISVANPRKTAVVDFNNDGNQDLAILDIGNNRVLIYIGNGLGDFTYVNFWSVGSTPYSVAVGDFNNDGKQDFATANNGFSNVSIRLGNPPLCYNGNDNTGGSAPASATYAPGATVTVLGNTGSLVRTGYTFSGWNTEADGSGTSRAPATTFNITAPAILYAQWLDTTAPSITVPSDITAEATSPAGAAVDFVPAPSATDETSPANPAVSCTPASGSTFPIGTTPVTCQATDDAGNTGYGYFNVTVVDTTAPSITVPSDITAEATGPSGATVNYVASASDGVGIQSFSCTPASGSTFAIGTTLVTCSASDAAGNNNSDTFNITVEDTTAPTLNVPANITVPQNIPTGAVVNFIVTASDLVDASPSVSCTPASGSTFPVGTTTVNCSATDDYANTSNGSFTVTVTAAPGDNLLKKPDFANAAVFPLPWRAFGFKPPYAATLDCTVFLSPNCSVVFGPGNRAAFQQVNRTGLAGDMYSFGMFSASQNAPIGGDYRIELSFFNNLNKPVGKVSLYFNPLTHGFELASGNAAPTGNYNKIIFRFIYNNSSGRAWFDDAFLYFLAP